VKRKKGIKTIDRKRGGCNFVLPPHRAVSKETALFVSRKPRDSRVVQNRLTGEKKSSKYDIISSTCQSK